jgi:tripartite-type tricarboxylate transporter receptor subunit TctC
MKLPRRQFLHLAAGAVALPALLRSAWAQAYPTRPVRIMVGFAAGGATDIVARIMGQWLSERLGQQFVVENRPGAATNLATEAAKSGARSNCSPHAATAAPEAMMLVNGFTIPQMVELIRAGLASASAERFVAGGRTMEIARVRITDAGRRALAQCRA